MTIQLSLINTNDVTVFIWKISKKNYKIIYSIISIFILYIYIEREHYLEKSLEEYISKHNDIPGMMEFFIFFSLSFFFFLAF